MKPWENEPNELRWESSGLRCQIIRRPWGHWCGYVGVDKHHVLYGYGYGDQLVSLKQLLRLRLQDMFSMPMMENYFNSDAEFTMNDILEVHGGVTYAGPGFSDEDKPLWWVGFDCAHAGDLVPKMERHWQYGVYRDMEYAKGETEKLAAQIAGVK